MKEYRVMWKIDVDGASAQDAASNAIALQRDANSDATVFYVTPRCECGEYHPEECEAVDLMGEVHVRH